MRGGGMGMHCRGRWRGCHGGYCRQLLGDPELGALAVKLDLAQARVIENFRQAGDQLKIGMRLSFRTEAVTDEVTMAVFAPEQPSA